MFRSYNPQDSEPEKSLTNKASEKMAAAAVCGPTGVKTWIELSDDMTAQQLKERAMERLPAIPGNKH